MNRWIKTAIWLIPAAVLVHACGGNAATDSTSGNTNWLKYCEVQADCGDGLSCHCNSCQETCDTSADCTIADPGSRCAMPSETTQCDDAPVGIRWCVKSCDVSPDCERDDLVCSSGSCASPSNGIDVSGDSGNVQDSGNTVDRIDASMPSPGPGPVNDAAMAECQPTVELVINRGSGMNRPFDGQDLWTMVRSALIDPGVSVLPQVESQVRLGLSLYANPGNVSTGPNQLQPADAAVVPDASPPAPIPWDPADDVSACLDVISVPIRSNNFGSIQFAFNGVEAVGSSPMADGINAAANKLAAFTGTGPKIILLTAPGDPDYCLDPDSNAQEGPRDAALEAVEDAWQKGITTRVVSLDTIGSAAATFMQRLAIAGAGGQATAQYYDIVDAVALQTAYYDIFQSLESACGAQ